MVERTEIADDADPVGPCVSSGLSSLTIIVLNGRVFSGEGAGEKFLGLSWVQRQLKEKTGFVPFPGTLNIKLTKKSVQLRRLMEEKVSIRLNPPEGYCSGLVFNGSVGELKCAVIVPLVQGYPADVLEIIAEVNIRKTLNLLDGDTVSVAVEV